MLTYQNIKQLVWVILSELKYNEGTVKKGVKWSIKFYWLNKKEQNIKVEAVSNTEDLYYGNRYSQQYNPRFRGNNRYNTSNKR